MSSERVKIGDVNITTGDQDGWPDRHATPMLWRCREQMAWVRSCLQTPTRTDPHVHPRQGEAGAELDAALAHLDRALAALEKGRAP